MLRAVTRNEIIAEIRRLAAEIGRPPGSKLFQAETGLAAHHWRGVHWARWSEALRDAGFEPNLKQPKADPDRMLAELAAAARRLGRFPTADELNVYRRTFPAPSLDSLSKHFGRRAARIARLRLWAMERPEQADLLALLPADPPSVRKRGWAAPPSQALTPGAGGFVRLFSCAGRHHLSRIGAADGRQRSQPLYLPPKAQLEHAIATDDPVGVEAYWRRRFAYRRLAEDWFALTDEDVAAFKRWRQI